MNFIEDHTAYIARLDESLSKISDIQLAKKRLTYTRWKVAENLDKLLFEFETNVKKNDAKVFWCPDIESSIQNLNTHLKTFSKIKFFNHNSVKNFANELNLNLPEPSSSPEVVVIGAKFIMANSGNFYSAFTSLNDYEQVINAKKIIVIASIDSVLAMQSELFIAKQLYAIFETGNLHYESEILARPGRVRGISAEIVLLLTDLNKNKLLEIPAHRPLFSLSNFELPPVCPMQRLNYDPENWKIQNTLSYVLYAFTHGIKEYRSHINAIYGLHILNQYIPYDIDLYEQIIDSRSLLHEEDKISFISKLADSDKSSIVLNSKKFQDNGKFKKYAEHNFFGAF
jgi:hypothetical protein